MNKFVRSVWLPIIVFLVLLLALEAALFIYGSFRYPMCKPGGNCPSLGPQYALAGLFPGIAFSLVVALTVQFWIRRKNI